jgi:hypothetical protein
MAEAATGWSKDDENEGDHANPPPIVRRGTRRAAEEIIATGNCSSINTDRI